MNNLIVTRQKVIIHHTYDRIIALLRKSLIAVSQREKENRNHQRVIISASLINVYKTTSDSWINCIFRFFHVYIIIQAKISTFFQISRTMIIRRVVCLKKCFIERKFSRSAKITWDAFLRNNNGGTSLKKFVVEHYDIAKAILENTEITRNHLTPEVKLFLLTENCPLYYESFHENGKFDSFTRNMFQDSFWSVYWPGGQALTRFIFDEKNEILKNKNTRLEAKRDELRILDLGAGCGATAIAAKLTIGSCKIVANDINKGQYVKHDH